MILSMRVLKELGSAGVTLAIVRVDALGHVDRPIPTMLNYATHIKGFHVQYTSCIAYLRGFTDLEMV